MDCSICLEQLTDDIYTLNCNHKYHRDCITRWIHTNPNCPLCREPIDADDRYVNDGIMSEERRRYIQNVKSVCLITAHGLEWLFPNGLQGYSEVAADFLDSEEGKQLLEEAGDVPGRNLPSHLLLTLGTSGLTQYLYNLFHTT